MPKNFAPATSIADKSGVKSAATADTATKGFTFNLLAVVIATNKGKKRSGASPTKFKI